MTREHNLISVNSDKGSRLSLQATKSLGLNTLYPNFYLNAWQKCPMGKTRSPYCNLSWLFLGPAHPSPFACSLNPLDFHEAASRWSSQWEGKGRGVFSYLSPLTTSDLATMSSCAHSLPSSNAVEGQPFWTTHPCWILFPGRCLTVSFSVVSQIYGSRFKSTVYLPVH